MQVSVDIGEPDPHSAAADATILLGIGLRGEGGYGRRLTGFGSGNAERGCFVLRLDSEESWLAGWLAHSQELEVSRL